MAITPNSVTAYIRANDKQKKVTPPVPPKPPKPLQTPEEYAEAFGAGYLAKPSTSLVGDAKTTTGEEQLKLNKQQENIKSRLTQNLNLSPKQRQDLQAETERIALGLNRTLSVGGPTPNFLKKLQNVVVSKIVAPFLSGTQTLATAGGDLSLQKQGEAWGGAISGATRQTMRVAQSAIKEIEDLRLDKPKDDGIYSLAKLKYDLLDLGSKFAVPLSIAADIQKAGNTKEKLLASKNIGGDKIEASLTDLYKQARDPDWGIKKTVIAQQNVKRNKIVGNIQNTVVNELTNPWNYITGVGEVAYVGKAGRLLLANKFTTLAMQAKYPALKEIGANAIARFGTSAIPREIRLAEGINTGLRIVGKPVKFTEPVGELVNFTWGRLRAVVGDVSRNATNYGLTVASKGAITETKAFLLPATRVASRKLGQKVAGEFVLSSSEAVQAVASWSARSHAKGTTGFQYNLMKDQAEGWVEEARKAGMGKTLINLVENPDLIKTYDEYKIVLKYRNWRDATYQATETAYKKFGVDFGAEVPDFSWIDDYVHHTMTREVKNWIRSIDGFAGTAKLNKFNPAHLSYEDVVTLGSPLKYRSLKIGEDFMGETVQKGTISEINEIFRRQSGQAFDFFETDIGSIADSYAYSMAKQHGREAFTRRLMAFGDDAVQKLLDTTIPDRALGARLGKVHKGLVSIRSSMRVGHRKGMTGFEDIVSRGVAHAESLVKENSIQRRLTIKQRDALVVKLTQLESNLAVAKEAASKVARDMRTNFDTVHAVMLDDIKTLRSEIATGDGDMSEVRHTLQQTYIAMFPNAPKVPDDVQVLADRILAARGIPANRELRALNAEMKQIRNMIELTDPKSPEYLALIEKEGYYKDLSNGYRILGEVRAGQTYAPDNGFLYTTMTDMGSPDAPFQLLHSEHLPFMGAPDVVGVHAIPDSELLDSRTSEGIQAIFGSDNFVKSIDTQLQEAGLDSGRVFIKTYYALKQGTPLDPEIERGFPDLVNLIESIVGSSKQEVPAGGDADLVHSIYNDFVDIATSIAHSSGFPDADDAARTIIDSALGDVALAANLGEQKKSGLLLPARLFDETADGTGVVVVKPADYSVSPSGSLTAPVQGADSPLLQSVMNSDYTTASDVAKGHLSAAASAKEELDVTRKQVQSRIAELTARKETIQAGTTAQKTVATQAKERVAELSAKPRTISIEGKTVTLDRKGVETALAAATKQEAKLRANLESNIVKAMNDVRVVNELAAPSEDVLLSIIDRVARDEGLSVRMLTGKPPTKGYMVAKKEFSTITKAPEFFDKNTGVDALHNYFRLRRVELSNKNYLGVWHDKANGEVVLDVVDNIMNIDEATRLGRERNQQSIWDVVNQKEIPTGGTGGREATTTGQAGNAVGTTPEAVSGDVGGGTAGVRRAGMGTPQRKQGQTIKGAEAQLIQYGDRLTTLFNQAEILKQWSDSTGNVLRQEIQAVGAAMMNMPARGVAGDVSREWVRSVQRTVQQTKFIKDKTVGKAYERITELLYVSDIGLAQAEDAIVASKLLRDDVLTGRTDAILAPVEARVLEGWEAIMGLGVQAPAQVLAIWKPNLQKMMSAANRGLFLRGLAATNNMFKTYAVTSVGFVVRNSYSSMFMNGVHGVEGQTIIDGARAMTALNKFGADKWLDELKITDPILRAQYEEALKVSITTGLQGSFTDLREPVIGGTVAEKIINKLNLETLSDKILPPRLRPVGSKVLDVAKKQGFVNNSYTGAVRRANTRVEAAVRFPMALHTLRKGGNYDDAVAIVTRYHFDYSDVSKLDEIAQQLLPFWIWTTRNIPNQITNQWMRPQAYSIWEGVQNALPVDDNEVIPAWIKPREPMGLGQRDTILGKGLYALTPDMPHQRLEEAIKMLVSPSRLIGSAYPYIKLPFEKYAGKNLGIDVGPFPERVPAKGIDLLFVKVMDMVGFDPIYDENKQMTTSGFAQYARGNINPIVARLQRLSGGKLGGKETYATRTGASWMSELGIPLSIIQDSAVRGEYINRKFKLEDWVKDLISRNLLAKETKK